MKIFRIQIMVILSLACISGQGQFQGGNGDGYVSGSAIVPLNSQTSYCSGGNADGYSEGATTMVQANVQSLYSSGGNSDGYGMAGTAVFPLNTQTLYCSGGNADGHSQGSWSGITFNPAIFCSGGDADGHARVTSSFLQINPQSAYCSGGNADGHSCTISAVIQMNTQAIYCSGGNADGHVHAGSGVIQINTQSLYCSGGNADGHTGGSTSGTLFDPVIFCTGGNADGHASGSGSGPMQDQSAYCAGGNADGFSGMISSLTTLGTGIWTGLVSTAWTHTGNWTNSVLPDLTTRVIIPTGCPNYPSLNGTLSINHTGGSYSALSLFIDDGATVTNSGGLSVYGSMIISGQYIANNNTSYSQNIQNGGTLLILPSGIVRIGNQSSGTGYSDLAVQSGGTLNVLGGILDIDDQLNIAGGGNFNMTGGSVFAHRYGLGSSYNSTSPGSLYVAPGATGSVSGGIVKVAGKTTVSSYTAVWINSSGFSFSGSSVLMFTDGVNISPDDVELKTVSGTALQNLIIDRPFRKVTLISDAVFTGNVLVGHFSRLSVKSGKTVMINGNLTLMN